MKRLRSWAPMGVALVVTLTVAHLASGCGGSAARSARPVTLDAPPPRATASDPPGTVANAAARQTERSRLEAACFAKPWVPARPELAPKPLSVQELERLDALIAPEPNGCRDVHPGLPPGRFGGGNPIPLPECHYGIARIFFESQRWTEAAHWFGKVTFEHASTEVGIFGAQLYLESLNVLASQGSPRRMECYELMAEDADRIACAYCRRPDNHEQCSIVRRVRFDVRQLLVTGAMPPATDACPSGERATARGCEPLPPVVPASCRE